VSEQKHTPGPWRYRRVGLGSTWWVEDADGVGLFSVWLPSQDDGEPTCPQWLAVLRTIACVNALDGIPDPAAFVERARAIEAERDELRNAAKEVLIGLGDKMKAMCRLERAVYNPTCLQKDTPHA
jgi:hypothetical protein